MSRKFGLIIFTKTPGISPVMTRLESDGVKSEALQREFIEDMQTRFSKYSDLDVIWAIAEDSAVNHVLWSEHKRWVQEGKDFESRLVSILNRAQKEFDKFIITASDYPHLLYSEIEDSFKSLDVHQFHFSPARDGGFTTCAMTKDSDVLVFESIIYSSDVTLSMILKNIDKSGQTYSLGELSFDIDHKSDLLDLLDLTRKSDELASLHQICKKEI